MVDLLLQISKYKNHYYGCIYIYIFIHSLVFSLEGRTWQEPEPSHVTGMALAHCILGKFLGVVDCIYIAKEIQSNFDEKISHKQEHWMFFISVC